MRLQAMQALCIGHEASASPWPESAYMQPEASVMYETVCIRPGSYITDMSVMHAVLTHRMQAAAEPNAEYRDAIRD